MTKHLGVECTYGTDNKGPYMTKHIDICYRHVNEMRENEELEVIYIPSEKNPGDIMTKNTPEQTSCTHRKTIYSGHVTPNREDDETTSTMYLEDKSDKMTENDHDHQKKKAQKEKTVKWKG